MKKHATLIIAFILGVLVGAGVTHTGEEDAKLAEDAADEGAVSEDPSPSDGGRAPVPETTGEGIDGPTEEEVGN